MVEPTQAQLNIRDHVDLDLLVVAPAGCGKTEALALRIQGLLQRGIALAPRRVLVATFSNRARDNIRDRLTGYLSGATLRDRITIANFHGLSARIYQAHAAVIGLSPSLVVPESDWVGEQCRSRNLNFNAAGAVQDLLREIKQQSIDDATVEQQLVDAGNPVALAIERQRVAEGRLTYDDLPRVAELILENADVANLYRHHFAAVIVDEFQDLTPQQLRIVNRIGHRKTTYAGDLAQGIYGFAGARPDEIDRQIRLECSDVIEFAESHRSSPAVLGMVNALASHTGGTELTCAKPDSWPSGGLAAQAIFDTPDAEANWALRFSQFILTRAPKHRIGIVTRTAGRRRFIEAAIEASDVPSYRWDDGVLDTDTARIVKAMLARLEIGDFFAASDPLEYLRVAAGLNGVQDPSIRESLSEALNWCCDLLQEGVDVSSVKSRIRIGDESTLLSVPGVHLLTGHVGKGQQFDWVLVIGAEEGSIPDFRATTDAAIQEEARILSVMLSRARHGAVAMCARNVPAAATGVVYRKQPSRFWSTLEPACVDSQTAVGWLQAAPWSEICKM
ncbi:MULTISPECIES: ATP-dependent helicase [unclassified Mycobacterium]|uniref:UvrD-helicase domain-containing protein n=1 Tax=unclassified Mycobacterium TaxID=2642494 RepID=UPI00048D53BE|nr:MULTISPECIES: ATP-dependent helicase [unclassified Mycobacterium]SEB01833.1 DNA helicase-2 / ATP-dependent DNA helicase PcrA [Mycobacterium sp. 283mftsu]